MTSSSITPHPIAARYWRMLGIRWQQHPYESGAHLTGGRWNALGVAALYLSTDYTTAIQEMHQDVVRPGTLIAFDTIAASIVDLTDCDRATTHCDWGQIYRREKRIPPTWALASELISDGVEGALVPSVRNPGGVNLVLWQWHAAGT